MLFGSWQLDWWRSVRGRKIPIGKQLKQLHADEFGRTVLTGTVKRNEKTNVFRREDPHITVKVI